MAAGAKLADSLRTRWGGFDLHFGNDKRDNYLEDSVAVFDLDERIPPPLGATKGEMERVVCKALSAIFLVP